MRQTHHWSQGCSGPLPTLCLAAPLQFVPVHVSGKTPSSTPASFLSQTSGCLSLHLLHSFLICWVVSQVVTFIRLNGSPAEFAAVGNSNLLLAGCNLFRTFVELISYGVQKLGCCWMHSSCADFCKFFFRRIDMLGYHLVEMKLFLFPFFLNWNPLSSSNFWTTFLIASAWASVTARCRSASCCWVSFWALASLSSSSWTCGGLDVPHVDEDIISNNHKKTWKQNRT